MFIIRILLFIFIFTTFLNAKHISPDYAVMLANDSYMKADDFKKKYNKKSIKVTSFESLGVRYFLLENKYHQIIVVRGTSTLDNFKTNSHFKETNFSSHNDIEVHKGFYEVAVNAKMQLKTILSKDKKTTLVGHSLGGAVSVLLGALLKDDNYKVHIYSFGMPAVANKMFSVKYKDLQHDRYAHRFDVVPLMKKGAIQTFKKALTLKNIVFKKRKLLKNLIKYFESDPYKYVHHGLLHKLKNKPIVDTSLEDKKFFQRQVTKVLVYHRVETYRSANL